MTAVLSHHVFINTSATLKVRSTARDATIYVTATSNHSSPTPACRNTACAWRTVSEVSSSISGCTHYGTRVAIWSFTVQLQLQDRRSAEVLNYGLSQSFLTGPELLVQKLNQNFEPPSVSSHFHKIVPTIRIYLCISARYRAERFILGSFQNVYRT